MTNFDFNSLGAAPRLEVSDNWAGKIVENAGAETWLTQ
jgi:hypothetical protein